MFRATGTMAKVFSKGEASASASMLEDLSNLITWAHNHATICLFRPSGVGSLDSGDGHRCMVSWQCERGHAYNWPFRLGTKNPGEHEKEDIHVVRPNIKRKRIQSHPDGEMDVVVFDSGGSCSSLVTHLSGGHGDAEWESNFDMELAVQEERLRPDSQHLSPGGMLDKKADLCASENMNPLTKATDDSVEMSAGNVEIQEPIEDPCSNLVEDLSSHVVPSSKRMTLNQQQREALSPPTSNTSRNVKAAATPKPAEKKVPKKMAAKLGNLRSFDAWISLQSTGRAQIIAKLDEQLADYFRYLREESENKNLTVSNLLCYVRTLNRDPLIQSNSCSLFKSPELSTARNALDVLMEELKQRERDRDMEVVQNLTLEEEVFLRQAGVLSRSNPEGLFNLVLLNNLRAFGKAHLQGVWPVRSCDLQLVQLVHPGTVGSGEKLEYLEWNPASTPQQYPLRMHGLCDLPEQCPLLDYKVYVSKRSGGIIAFHDAFYCTFNSQKEGGDRGWYTRTAMSKHRMKKMLKTLSHKILALGDQGAATGHTS